MFTIDAHLDLAMNAMDWNRDLRLSISELRERESGMTDKPDRANGTVSLPALRAGKIGLVVATQIARFAPPGSALPGWHSPQQAWAHTQAQRAWYHAMENEGEMRSITDREALEEHVNLWEGSDDGGKLPIGFVLSLEGADSLVDLTYLEKAYRYGLRVLGPAHYGPGRWANGTDSSGLMGPNGLELLREMNRLDMILDVTHLCDDAFWQALDHFHGPVWASHNNCRSLVPHQRQFTDDQLRALIERGAVIGMALDAWMIVPKWERGTSTATQMNCGLEQAIDHLDHICQMPGNCAHVGIGSDLDGAFGKEQCPHDVDTIADLQQIPSMLRDRGYNDADVENVMSKNWLNFLRRNWKH